MKIQNSLYLLLALSITSCIGVDIIDDEVDPRIVILNPIDSLKIGDKFPLEAKYFNNVGFEEEVSIKWNTSNDKVLSVSEEGLVEALTIGDATITASFESAQDSLSINTGQSTSATTQSRVAELVTVSSYPLSGTVNLEVDENGITNLRFENNFETTSALPGLYVYLSNNKNTTAGAYEIGAVTDFSGAQSYEIDPSVGINEFNIVLFFCKPFNVAIGNGELEP